MTANSFEEWHPHGFDDWWAREMEYQGFTSAHDGARRAWHECLRLFAAESASRAALLSPDVAGLVEGLKNMGRPLTGPEQAVIHALESLAAQNATKLEALRYIFGLMNDALPGMDECAPIEHIARKFVEHHKSLAAQVAERDAEIARLKMENSKLRSALEIVHFKREPWQ